MPQGRVWPPEWEDYSDPKTGVTVRRLTNYKGHSHHLYFTNPGWYAGCRKLLFGSDRENRTNLFSVDLETGEIVQLTDLEPQKPHLETDFLSTSFLFTSINPRREEAYFWYGRQIVALDLNTLEMRTLWETPKGFVRSMLNCTADGKHVCAGLSEDLSSRFRIDLSRGYIGFTETWQANPLSRIVRIAVDGSGSETVWEERTWIGHVNTSPTRPNLITFCHEGPWDRVDNRIWGLDLNTRKAWKIRPREGGESVGHEYWLAHGVHIGYHGRWPNGQKLLGKIRYDNADRVEFTTPYETGHMHSNDFTLIVGDAGRDGFFIRIWRWNGKEIEGPRLLCEHRSSFHIQRVHVHPRFSPDGKQVLYTSDTADYGNLYIAQVPRFESLPEIEQTSK